MFKPKAVCREEQTCSCSCRLLQGTHHQSHLLHLVLQAHHRNRHVCPVSDAVSRQTDAVFRC